MVPAATIAALLLTGPAVADPDPVVPPEASQEITVWGEHPAREARLEVVEAMEAEGYRHDRTRNGKDIFVAPEPYKPKVVLDRDGYVVTRRRNLVWVGSDGRANEATFEPEDALCVLWPPACISTRGAQFSKKKFEGKVNRVLNAIAPEMKAYREALQYEGHAGRMQRLLPHELDQLWFAGIGADGTTLDDPLARRDAIVELWVTRVDDIWGDEAREVIERFLRDHVQDTEWALTEAEIAAVDLRYEGSRPFVLSDERPAPEVASVPPIPAEAPPEVLPEPASSLMHSPLFDIPPVGTPRRQPLEWLRGTEEDAVEAAAIAPVPPPHEAPGPGD